MGLKLDLLLCLVVDCVKAKCIIACTSFMCEQDQQHIFKGVEMRGARFPVQCTTSNNISGMQCTTVNCPDATNVTYL